MCDSESRDYNRKIAKETPFVELPHVRVDMPLTKLNSMYVELDHARRVLREGNPEQKVVLASRILAQLSMKMNEASGGFLAARNI
ncbi:MAG: hypothetical protein EON60_06395 [Alphaproteobacteria bacterium]|nr:MAG: hypothetical protein EON60_11155 [Alphaproteobacteria bacterium]RYG60637.1 MAG: hypothetical protein EON60_06395 [Alphaproteobacteria bacterium]